MKVKKGGIKGDDVRELKLQREREKESDEDKERGRKRHVKNRYC